MQMTSDSREQTLKYPCALCMGFCLEHTNCIRCSICVNWFHQKCCKLSARAFNQYKSTTTNIDSSFIKNSNYICKFCTIPKPCNVCNEFQLNAFGSLYCVTCQVRICDGCNSSFSCDQIKEFKETDKPFYCTYCEMFYPCKVCKEHCFNDTVHDPSIYCDCCQQWLHHSCSKLSHVQFNKLGNGNMPYYCHICINENVPFSKITKSSFINTVIKCSANSSAFRSNAPVCTLCIECNHGCEECQICPDLHRICDGCSSKCKYVTVGKYNNLDSDSATNDKLKLLHVNIRSLTKHITELDNLILNDFDNPPDIICVSETKLNSSSNSVDVDNLDLVQLPGYSLIHNPSTTNAGGSGIFLSHSHTLNERSDLNIQIEGECEASFLEIDSKKGKNIIIGSLYRHPHDNFEEFFKAFSKVIEKVNKRYWLIILGDLNINIMDYSCSNTKAYKNLLLSLGLRNLINLPTRVADTSETVLDHCITNLPPNGIESGVIQEVITDHFPIYAQANLSIKKPNLPFYHFRRRFPYSKKEKFLNVLQKRIDDCDGLLSLSDPFTNLNELISILQLTANQIFPVTKLSCKERKKFKHPWITTGILKSRDRKFELLNRSMELKTDESRKTYTRYRNKLTHTIEAAKANYHAKGFEDIGNDTTKIWKKINKMKNTNPKTASCLPEKLITKNSKTVIRNAKSIANQLNKHFVKKGLNLASKLPPSQSSIYKTLGARNFSSMTFDEITVSELVNIVKEFENKRSTGEDGIPAILIKWSINIIAPILTKLFNKFVMLGIYPDNLKVAKITPLHKKGDKSDPDNFRPISVLSQINKIFEKVIHVRLSNFVDKHSLLPNNQFGFRKKHSASHGITHLNEQIIKNLESKKVSTVLFMDLNQHLTQSTMIF